MPTYQDKQNTSLFVCVEVLQPSQPNGVMLSAVSLPNHMFTGQASSKWLTSIVHILLPETDQWVTYTPGSTNPSKGLGEKEKWANKWMNKKEQASCLSKI